MIFLKLPPYFEPLRVKTTSHIKKLFPTEVGGGSGEIGMVSQLLLVLNYDSFPYQTFEVHSKKFRGKRAKCQIRAASVRGGNLHQSVAVLCCCFSFCAAGPKAAALQKAWNWNSFFLFLLFQQRAGLLVSKLGLPEREETISLMINEKNTVYNNMSDHIFLMSSSFLNRKCNNWYNTW